MRSPADRMGTQRVERVLRATAFVAVVLWLANALRPALGRVGVATDATLARALSTWTTSRRIDSAHVALDTVPDATHSAWLAALGRAGVGVTWSGNIPATALEAAASADPGGGIIVLATTPQGTQRIVGDALGPIDTLRAPMATVRYASLEGDVVLTADRQAARSSAPAHTPPRRVLVAGPAGWEAKFVVAALEESGWQVDAHLFVSPDHDVLQGPQPSLDTARYAAVVLLDSSAAELAKGIERFVREGGGLVLAGDASTSPKVAQLVAWRVAKHETAPLGTLPADTSWRGLSRFPLLVDTARAIVIAASGNASRVPNPVSLVTGHRVFNGRVAAVGYDATWRWRMAGGDSSRAIHRDWWSRIVAGVAYRPVSNASVAGAAPLAAFYATLGAPSPAIRALPAALAPSALSNLLGFIALAALLSEWWLRRARGQR